MQYQQAMTSKPTETSDADLLKRAKIRSRRAVIGVSNQRVVVRQVDLPFLEEKEFRSSLRFQIADHIDQKGADGRVWVTEMLEFMKLRFAGK